MVMMMYEKYRCRYGMCRICWSNAASISATSQCGPIGPMRSNVGSLANFDNQVGAPRLILR